MITIARPTFLVLILCSTAAAQVSFADLKSGPNQNWLTYIGDYFAQRFSPLTQINRDNISRLTPKWVRHIDGANELETVPLVYDGVMYATNSNEVYALDAVSGKRCGITRRRAFAAIPPIAARRFWEIVYFWLPRIATSLHCAAPVAGSCGTGITQGPRVDTVALARLWS